MTDLTLKAAYDDLQAEATILAGGLTDLAQRATVYHHLYRASGGNHVFPLIAAHGALWAGGYFRFGMKLGQALSYQYMANPKLRRKRMDQLQQFADAFRNVNRQVCVDTYVNFHLSARYLEHPEIGQYIPPNLLHAYAMLHHANENGQELSNAQRKTIFEAHFLHEQQTIVGDTVRQAVADFDWPAARFLVPDRPCNSRIFPMDAGFGFVIFPIKTNASPMATPRSTWGPKPVWHRVEQSLADYHTLPSAFFAGPVQYFQGLRSQLLTVS